MAIEKTTNKLGLSFEEIEKITSLIGHEPNFAELCIIIALGNSESRNISFSEAFEITENSDNIDLEIYSQGQSFIKLDEQLSCFMKTETNDLLINPGPYAESTNCLSTAIRRVIASGATPVAILNTFRFGHPSHETTKKVARESLKGIGEIGNTSGYPIVGAKINFETCFTENPELNTFVVGIIDGKEKPISLNHAKNYTLFMVSDDCLPTLTDTDEIKSKTDIINILRNSKTIINNGLFEKKLQESALEIINSGNIARIEPVTKNGILECLFEMAQSIQKGLYVDLNKITGNKPFEQSLELLVSGKYAKLLILIESGKEYIAEKIYKKWELNFSEIGKTQDDKKLVFTSGNKLTGDLPIDKYWKNALKNNLAKDVKTENLVKKQAELKNIPLPENLKEVAWFMIKHPNIASKKCLNEQYDSMAGNSNMGTNFVSDAQLINIKGTENALALCMTGNQKHIKANASIGAQIAVAAACRKIVCSGAKPIAIQPSISFLNVQNPVGLKIFNELTNGLNKACRQFNLPINNENIKLHATSEEQDTLQRCPGLIVGMMGLLKNKNNQMTISFKNKGNIIFLIGSSMEDISASEYLVSYHKIEPETAPYFDLELEYNVQSTVLELIEKKYVCSAHNVSRGGLFISLVESAMISGFGFDIISDTDIRLDAFLFGESQGRVLVSINPNKETNFIDLMIKKKVPFLALGHVTKGEMRIDDISFGFIEDAKRVYENALEEIMSE